MMLSMKTITPKEAQRLIEKGEAISIDVRTKEEYAGGHIDSATNFDFFASNFEDEIKKLDKIKHYIVNCQSGGRSGRTVALMNTLGFTEVYNLEGGITAYKNAGLHVVL